MFKQILLEIERTPDKAIKLLNRIRGMKKFSKPDIDKKYLNPDEHRSQMSTLSKKVDSYPKVSSRHETIMHIDINKLRTHQDAISPHVVNQKIKDNDDSLPTVYHHTDGNFYVDDGNHQIAKHRLMGKRTIKVRVYSKEPLND
jgi:hypothetical protein